MKGFFTPLNTVTVLGLSLTTLTIFGFLPRETAFLVALLYIGYVIFAPAERGTQLFLRLIPFFIALPLSASFDNFNTWRILLAVLALRWAFENRRLLSMLATLRAPLLFLKQYRLEAAGILFIALSAASIAVGIDYWGGVLRIIYLVNAATLFVIVRSLVAEKSSRLLPFARSFVLGALIAVVFGYVQFFSAYFVPAWMFHYWWGQEVSVAQYGQVWGNIATNEGNTWFSYSGGTLRLRMFSLFPDSHTFPMYILMALPALFAILFDRWGKKLPFLGDGGFPHKERGKILLLFAVLFLALILSGTRGIWLASLSTLAVVFVLHRIREGIPYARQLATLLALFLLMVPFYFLVALFPQFQDSEFSALASLGRLRSVIDFGETSNLGRIAIWTQTIEYVRQSPFWGIGIANYPLILSESLTASLAGSSAHNLYLHMLATTGVFSLLSALWFMWELFWRGLQWVRRHSPSPATLYQVGILSSLVWLGAYLMTDAALFDERALLGFMTMSALAAGLFVSDNDSPKV